MWQLWVLSLDFVRESSTNKILCADKMSAKCVPNRNFVDMEIIQHMFKALETIKVSSNMIQHLWWRWHIEIFGNDIHPDSFQKKGGYDILPQQSFSFKHSLLKFEKLRASMKHQFPADYHIFEDAVTRHRFRFQPLNLGGWSIITEEISRFWSCWLQKIVWLMRNSDVSLGSLEYWVDENSCLVVYPEDYASSTFLASVLEKRTLKDPLYQNCATIPLHYTAIMLLQY